MAKGKGTREDPWQLNTPPGGSAYTAYRDETSDPPALVAQVGKTEVRYDLRCIDDLHAMLKKHGDWMPLGNADEQKPAADGTVEAWARSPKNPVKGFYGLKKGLRGRFANYVFLRLWRRWDSRRWSTSPATTGCARSSRIHERKETSGPRQIYALTGEAAK